MVGNNLHGQMRFAIGRSAAHRRAHSRRDLGIDPIHVQRDMVPGCSVSGRAQGLFHYCSHAALVDVAHGIHGHASAANVLPLRGVDLPHPYQHRVLRRNLGRIAENLRQRFRPQSQQRGQRHPMYVARGRSLRRVDVRVGIYPHHPDLLSLAAIELRHSGDRSGGQRVVPAQHQRRHSLLDHLHHSLGGARAGLGNLFQIVRIFLARGLRLGNLHANVASVGHLVAQRLQPRLQPGNAHRRGPHVHPTAAGAQIKRNADHTDTPGRLRLRAVVRNGRSGIGNFSGIRHTNISQKVIRSSCKITKKPALHILALLRGFGLFRRQSWCCIVWYPPHPYFGRKVVVFLMLQTGLRCKVVKTKELFAKSSRIRS